MICASVLWRKEKSKTAAVAAPHAAIDLEAQADVAMMAFIRASRSYDMAVGAVDMDLLAHLRRLIERRITRGGISFVVGCRFSEPDLKDFRGHCRRNF